MENVKIKKDILGELKERTQKIVEQNRALIARLRCRGFNPVTELDFTANNAGLFIRKFFEAVAKFDEGKVPYGELKMLFHTTNLLVDKLKKRNDAPVCELEDFGSAFREAGIIWKDNHPEPLMARAVYLKKHFDAEMEIKKTLRALHAAYVKQFAAKGKKTKTLSAADVDVNSYDDGSSEDRNRIYQEIDRLRKDGYSVKKAIESMRNGSYGSRMREVSSETWKRYYLERSRRIRLENKAKKSIPIQDYTIPRGIDRVCEPVAVSRESVKKAVAANPGIKCKTLIEIFCKSRSTVMRVIAELKDSGEIKYDGSDKKGGYYLTENEGAKSEENSTSAMMG